MIRNVLAFGANSTDRIQCPDSASTNTLSPYSIIQWIYPTAFSGTRRLWHKGAVAGASQRHLIVQAGATLTGFQDMTGATPDNTFTTSTVLIANKWQCVITTFEASADGLRVFIGDLVSPPSEAAYSARAVNAGTPASDSGGGYVICNANIASFARAFEGLCAYTVVVNYWMRLAEVREWYYTGKLPSGVKISFPSILDNGPVTILDRSGMLNHGTVTGAVPRSAELPWLIQRDLEQMVGRNLVV